MKYKRTFLAFLLALALCLSLFPASAFAAGKETRTTQPCSPVLTFSSSMPFELSTANHSWNWNGIIEYSTDNSTWRLWDGTATIRSAWHNNQERLYLRGSGNTRISNGEMQRWVLSGIDHPSPCTKGKAVEELTRDPKISCSGNIEYLLHYHTVDAGGHPTMAAHCFDHLFYNCTTLVKAPSLPAENLTDYCYAFMFAGCTALKNTPKLPATSLKPYCYWFMFYDCNSITMPPVLPALSMETGCYQGMFQSCSSLTSAPELPATELAALCYDWMFTDCTSLRAAPELPATELKTNCYAHMFYGCTALKIAVDLPEATMADYCCAYMFAYTNITETPQLSPTVLAHCCYESMFRGCALLQKVNKLPATTLARSCYYCMFSDCTALKNAPALPLESLADYCYDYMFGNCTALETIPALSADYLPNGCYRRMFYGCTNLKLSEVETDEYNTEYSVPIGGNAIYIGTDALNGMFENTGGTFTGPAEANTTYYLHNSNSIVY